MMRTIEATIDAGGHVRLKEEVPLKGTSRVLVTFLDQVWEGNEAAILAEPSLASGWLGSEADEAWKHLSELPDLDKEVK